MTLCGQGVGTSSLALAQRFLVVAMGGSVFAFEDDSVSGVLAVEEAGETRVVTAEGLSYETIGLADRLALLPEAEGPHTRIVLLAKGRAQGSVRVARVHGLIELDQTQIFPIPLHFQNAEQDWYRGMFLFQEGVALVLDTAWVLQQPNARQPGDDHGFQERGRRLLSVRPDITMGKVQEC